MQPATFIQTLRHEVGLLQAQYPDRADEVSRACALIAMGYVVDQGDGDGKVLSSDGKRFYTVNGQCDCEAAQHGRHCKHLSAWRLYRHVEKKLASRMPQDATSAPRETPASQPADVPTALPEARASLNLKVLISGFETQITLRDHDEAQLLQRLQALLKRSDIRPIPKPAPRQSGGWKRNTQGR